MTAERVLASAVRYRALAERLAANGTQSHDDLQQEAVLELVRKGLLPNDRAHALMREVLRRERRQARIRDASKAEIAGAAWFDPRAEYETHQAAELLERCLGELDARERQVVQLHFFDDVGFEHVATALRMSARQVIRIQATALAKLKVCYAGLGIHSLRDVLSP